MISAGVVDLAGAPVTLDFGDGAFVDFARFWGPSHTVRFAGGQLINAESATITAGKNSFINFPAGFDTTGGLGSLSSEGIVHIDGTPVQVSAGQRLGGTGGIAGNVTNQGLISPGNSPGELIVDGDFTQGSGGTVLMEIAGTAPDAYDILSISGPASLDGTLQLTLLNGFIPSPTDQFTILTAGSLQGLFNNAQSTIGLAQGTFTVQYSSTAVTLTNFSPVPEPGSIAALLVFVGAGVARRRREN